MLKLSVWLHLIAAMFWIGGMLFLILVIAPFLKGINDPAERSRIYQIIGKTYRFWGWIAIAILLVTGSLNLYLMGIPLRRILTPDFYASPYGRALIIKLSLVSLIVVTSFSHDFIFGPKAIDSFYYSSLARLLGRINLIIALLIVLFGVILRFGGIS